MSFTDRQVLLNYITTRLNDLRESLEAPFIDPRLADYYRGIANDGVRFAAAAGRLSATLIYRHYDFNYGRGYGDGFNANGVNSYPRIITAG